MVAYEIVVLKKLWCLN